MRLNMGRGRNSCGHRRPVAGERRAREDAQAVAITTNPNQHKVEDRETCRRVWHSSALDFGEVCAHGRWRIGGVRWPGVNSTWREGRSGAVGAGAQELRVKRIQIRERVRTRYEPVITELDLCLCPWHSRCA